MDAAAAIGGTLGEGDIRLAHKESTGSDTYHLLALRQLLQALGLSAGLVAAVPLAVEML